MRFRTATDDINDTFIHFGLYKLAKRYKAIVRKIIIALFAILFSLGLIGTFMVDDPVTAHLLLNVAKYCAFGFIGIIVIVGIDRWHQIIQLNACMDRHHIRDVEELNGFIERSNFPWAAR